MCSVSRSFPALLKADHPVIILFIDLDEFRPVESANAWLCVWRQVLMDRATIDDHTLLGNKNFFSAKVFSVLKETLKILNPISGVFTATVHFHTIFHCRTWSPATKVEQDHMSWVALKARKLMSQVWRRNAWKKLLHIWYLIFDLLYICLSPLKEPVWICKGFESVEVLERLPYWWELVAPHDRQSCSGNLGPDHNQARGTIHTLGIDQNRSGRWTCFQLASQTSLQWLSFKQE